MEQTQYWMWPKTRHGLSSNLQASKAAAYDDSWEEHAFAEDAAGTLGAGCIWPPRSYSCSFCRREFRSAQALGGHMNIHRRDRARLKQSPSPQAEVLLQNHQNHVSNNHFASLGYPSQDCNLVYNHNPNPTSPSSRISASLPTKGDCPDDHKILSPFSSPILQEHQKKSFPNKSWSNVDADKIHYFSDLMKTEGEKNMRILESECTVNVQTDLSVSLNLVVRRTRPTVSGEEEESVCCKRRRIDATSLPFFLKPVSINKHQLQPEVINLSPSSIDELDLELRLGDRPKVSS
ncbi:hypothetical protein SLA2020_118160 [Shorea laevis]